MFLALLISVFPVAIPESILDIAETNCAFVLFSSESLFSNCFFVFSKFAFCSLVKLGFFNAIFIFSIFFCTSVIPLFNVVSCVFNSAFCFSNLSNSSFACFSLLSNCFLLSAILFLPLISSAYALLNSLSAFILLDLIVFSAFSICFFPFSSSFFASAILDLASVFCVFNSFSASSTFLVTVFTKLSYLDFSRLSLIFSISVLTLLTQSSYFLEEVVYLFASFTFT